jgi:glutamate-1-semialdehyde 2,1-aminomutase
LSGNPLATAAGLATLQLLREPGVYERLERTSAAVAYALQSAAKDAGVAVTVQRQGSMLTVFFCSQPVRCWQDAAKCDTARFARFHRGMLEQGVYWPPSQYEAAFVSLAHDQRSLQVTEQAARKAFASL